MKFKYNVVLGSTVFKIYFTDVHSHCVDIHGQIVSQGLHYVPGSNPCTLCICDKGGPKWCKSVLCSPPQNCKSFQVGNSCCEFKCLDDILSGHDTYKETYDVALRFIASTITAVLSISLLFFLYNKLKRHNSLHNHHSDDHRSVRSGYITNNFGYGQHGLSYLSAGTNNMDVHYEDTYQESTSFPIWKPPGNYFPSGEAPPPYEEAMRSTQNEQTRNHLHIPQSNSFISTVTTNYPNEITSINCTHVDTPNNINQFVSVQEHDATKLHIRNINGTNCNVNSSNKSNEVSYENIAVLKNLLKNEVASSSGINNYNVTKTYNVNLILDQNKSENAVGIKLNERSQLHGNIKLNKYDKRKIVHRTLPKNLRELLSNAERIDCLKLQCTSFETPVVALTVNEPSTSNVGQVNSGLNGGQNAKHLTNLLTYQSLSQDEEDYRSECENCKSVMPVIEDDHETSNETMSLQRRPAEQCYDLACRTSLTLPCNTKTKPRTYDSTNRRKWFSSMHPSSSEESD